MKEIGLDDVTQLQRETSEQLLVDLIRSKYPRLDLRIGTALRDLLVIPDAIIHAWLSANLDEHMAVTSLQVLLERANNGEEISTEDVNRILSNFNLEGTSGTSATGTVRVVVSQARTYVVPVGFEFRTDDGRTFTVTSQVVATPNPSGTEIKLFNGTANYYFLVPARCTAVGSDGNITKGTLLYAGGSLPGFVSAYAYADFSGGADVEDISSVKARIQTALSVRGLLNKNAVEAVLRDRFDDTENPIVAVSTVGYGNSAQLRDKHNPFGIGVGGRVDVYVRNFTAPYVKTLDSDFTWDEDTESYVSELDIPGMYSISAVSDPGAESIASYSYSVEYGASSVDTGFHDFDTSKDTIELAGTVWRSCKIYVKGIDHEDDTKQLSVSAICLPNVDEMQIFVDEDSVRNVGSDFVVRCPAVCRVSMNITCRYPFGTVFDVSAAKTAISNYVNTSGFVGRITRSEIACVLSGVGASSVDIIDDHMLSGIVVDAKGNTHVLYGDSLNIDDIEDPSGMLTRDTCVFSTTPDNISITAIPA